MKQAVNQGFVDTAKSPTSFGKPPRPDRPKGDAADSTGELCHPMGQASLPCRQDGGNYEDLPKIHDIMTTGKNVLR